MKPFALAVFLVACGSGASAAPPSDAGSGAGAGDVAKNQAKQDEKQPNETKKDREKKRERRLQRKRQMEKRSRQVWRGPLVRPEADTKGDAGPVTPTDRGRCAYWGTVTNFCPARWLSYSSLAQFASLDTPISRASSR